MRKEICVLLALCLLGCSRADLPRAPRSDDAQARHEQIPLRNDEFDLTVDQFVRVFNAAAKSCGLPYRVASDEPRRGLVLHNYFEQSFPGDVSLRANLSKDSGRITSITLLASGRKNAPDRDTILEIAEIIVLVTDSSMTQKKAHAMIADMLQESLSAPEADRLPQRYFEHARYVLRNDNGVDYWWIASPN